MTPSLKRTALGTLSIISFILSTILLYRLPANHSVLSLFYFNLAENLIFSYNIAIIFAWLAFGITFGIAITLISALFVLLLNLRIGLVGHTIFTLPFFFTAFFGFQCWRTKNRIEDAYRLKMEKLDEDMNAISNSMDESRKGISSVEEKLNRYAALKDVLDSFSTQLMVSDITKLIMEKTAKTIGKPGRILLFMVDTEKQELMLAGSQGAERVAAKKGDIFDKWVLKHRRPLIVEDVSVDFRFPTDGCLEPEKAFRALIVTPLISGDKVIGILRMDNPRELVYSQDDLRLLGIIADLGAVAIENAFLYARTQELAIRDSLTGLAVRRYFLERLHAEVKRTAMKKGQLALLMLDIDHFKKYNDQFGHAAGDIVLKHIAQVLSSIVREGDIVARYGGEEIVVMLCGRNKQAAEAEAEEMRAAVKSSPITLRRHTANVTVSIGIACYHDDASSSEGLIKIADERLYKAKGQGRDRVCSA